MLFFPLVAVLFLLHSLVSSFTLLKQYHSIILLYIAVKPTSQAVWTRMLEASLFFFSFYHPTIRHSSRQATPPSCVCHDDVIWFTRHFTIFFYRSSSLFLLLRSFPLLHVSRARPKRTKPPPKKTYCPFVFTRNDLFILCTWKNSCALSDRYIWLFYLIFGCYTSWHEFLGVTRLHAWVGDVSERSRTGGFVSAALIALPTECY